MRRAIVTVVLRLAVGLLVGQGFAMAQESCSTATITAFSVEQYPGRTADGTPTPGNAGVIAAASYNYALGTVIWIDGVGSRRVADRGHLGPNHIDLLFQTTREALEWGVQHRQVCQ